MLKINYDYVVQRCNSHIEVQKHTEVWWGEMDKKKNNILNNKIKYILEDIGIKMENYIY